ncbi:MAG: hypothetical protein SEPTF4163_006539, partial [Sporothrix epigloea]
MAFIELYDSAKDSASSSVPSPESYQPSLSDAVAVKALLQRRTCFPLELVDAIMDEAAYWAPYPCRVETRDGAVDGRFPHRPYRGSSIRGLTSLERYGWQGEHAQQVVSGKEEVATKSFKPGPLTPLAPDSAVLYTIRPGIVARPPPPPPQPGDSNYKRWYRLNRPRRKPRQSQPIPRWKFDFPPEPGDDRIQSNRVVWWNFKTHTVAWSWNDKKPAPVLVLPQHAPFEDWYAALREGLTG